MFRSLPFAFFVILAACTPDPVANRAEELALAIAAKDKATLEASHVLGTRHNGYCDSDEFGRVLDEVKRGSSAEKCERFVRASPEEVAALQDEALLLFQIARMVCENPNLTCEAYGARVVASQIEEDPLWGNVQGPPMVRKVIRKDAEPVAAAYVEFTTASGPQVRALKFRQIEGRWLLTDGFPAGAE
ncbi:MAG: hypothetical protein R3E66_11930 [bacterium]